MFILTDVLKALIKEDVPEMSLNQANLILKKLQTDNFISESKYNVHKKAWLNLTYKLFEEFKVAVSVPEDQGKVWTQIMKDSGNLNFDPEEQEFIDIAKQIQGKLRLL